MVTSSRLGLAAALAVIVARATVAGAAADAPAARAPDLRSQRARALDSLRRAEIAGELQRLGGEVDWRRHSLSELQDFRDRAAAALELGARFGISVDWRRTTLPVLRDIGLRATQSALLASEHGVTVDWRRFSLRQLEELQRTMARLDPGRAPLDHDGLMSAGRLSAQGPARPGADDPDAVMEPAFTGEPARAWTRLAMSPDDIDGVLEPEFMPAPPEMTISPFIDDDAALEP